MEQDPAARLRILIAEGRGKRFQQVTDAVASLGHEVVAHEMELAEVGEATARLKPEVAIVIVGESTEGALRMIGRIVQEAACPVIAVLAVQDRAFINEAAKRGIFAYIVDGEDPEEFQGSIDIVLRRFAEFTNLEGAFGRRAVTERAKGVLMERHSLDEHQAFALLRDHARRSNRKIVDIAEALLASHQLLSNSRTQEPHSAPSDLPE